MIADQMERKNAELMKERRELRYRLEEVDKKRMLISLEDVNISKDRETLKTRKDIVSI